MALQDDDIACATRRNLRLLLSASDRTLDARCCRQRIRRMLQSRATGSSARVDRCNRHHNLVDADDAVHVRRVLLAVKHGESTSLDQRRTATCHASDGDLLCL